jgi:hypothetical protein
VKSESFWKSSEVAHIFELLFHRNKYVLNMTKNELGDFFTNSFVHPEREKENCGSI